MDVGSRARRLIQAADDRMKPEEQEAAVCAAAKDMYPHNTRGEDDDSYVQISAARTIALRLIGRGMSLMREREMKASWTDGESQCEYID